MTANLSLMACLNGRRTPTEHPAIAITPAELAVGAKAAVAAGADGIHVHPRRVDGVESLDAGDVAAAVRAIRLGCGGVPIGVSTGLWIVDGDVALRHRLVSGWSTIEAIGRPDFASVNVHEPGFAELVDVLQRTGVDVEAGVWSVADAELLAGVMPRIPWARVLVEIIDASADAAPGIAKQVLVRLHEALIPGSRLLHGEDGSCWPLLRQAGALGLSTRIGLEDTLTGPDGCPVADNAELVRLALSCIRRYDRA